MARNTCPVSRKGNEGYPVTKKVNEAFEFAPVEENGDFRQWAIEFKQKYVMICMSCEIMLLSWRFLP